MDQEEIADQEGTKKNWYVSSLRTIRTLRILKPLRLLSKLRWLKVAFNTVIISLFHISTQMALCMISVVVFGIFGQYFFANKFMHCWIDNDPNLAR